MTALEQSEDALKISLAEIPETGFKVLPRVQRLAQGGGASPLSTTRMCLQVIHCTATKVRSMCVSHLAFTSSLVADHVGKELKPPLVPFLLLFGLFTIWTCDTYALYKNALARLKTG